MIENNVSMYKKMFMGLLSFGGLLACIADVSNHLKLT